MHNESEIAGVTKQPARGFRTGRYSTLPLLVFSLMAAACGSSEPTQGVSPAEDAPAIGVSDTENTEVAEVPGAEVSDAASPAADDTQAPGAEVSDVTSPGADDIEVSPVVDLEPDNTRGIADNVDVYSQDGYADVDVIRIDVKTFTTAGICELDDLSGCTFADVLADTNPSDLLKVDIPIHFKASDFADDGSTNNAELRQRGGGTRLAEQKSFRIKLDDKDTLWRSERHLQLNKHPFDSSRIRNKLAFDLMSGIPNLTSFRTQFVNLWIDDGLGAVDNGLYTHVERGDERYLGRHGIDDSGSLYKAQNFKFSDIDRSTLLIDEQGEPVNTEIFETVLEIENGEDHRNLVDMLEALHDPSQPFDAVLERYFDEDNVLTWITVNLLLGQQDATRHNYFLFNPQGSEKFYFLPWDYDAAFVSHELPANDFTELALRARLKFGYAVGSQNDFIDLFYRREGTHEKIVALAAQLRNNYLDNARISERAEILSAAAAPYASALPDISYNEFYTGDSSAEFSGKVAFNQTALNNNFGIPLPPTLAVPERTNDSWSFQWTPAFDVTGNAVTYELQLASGARFLPDEIVTVRTGSGNSMLVDAQLLGAGVHYARLIARSVNQPELYWQVADNELEENGETHYGVIKFGN